MTRGDGGDDASIAKVLSFVMATTNISSLSPLRWQCRTNSALMFANLQAWTRYATDKDCAGTRVDPANSGRRRPLRGPHRGLNARMAGGIQIAAGSLSPLSVPEVARMTSITAMNLGALALIGAFVQPCAPSATTNAALERVASLHTARSVHTATSLKSGQVLIVGGMASGGESLANVELFDPRV